MAEFTLQLSRHVLMRLVIPAVGHDRHCVDVDSGPEDVKMVLVPGVTFDHRPGVVDQSEPAFERGDGVGLLVTGEVYGGGGFEPGVVERFGASGARSHRQHFLNGARQEFRDHLLQVEQLGPFVGDDAQQVAREGAALLDGRHDAAFNAAEMGCATMPERLAVAAEHVRYLQRRTHRSASVRRRHLQP